jgi:putative ATPase
MDTLFEEDAGPESPAGGPDGGQAAAEGRPLAVRMRPAGLEEFVGQSHLLGGGSALRTAIEQGHPHSMVLYGPPGSGKTTLARMLAERSRAAFEELSAVQAGRAEVREVIERAKHRRATATAAAESPAAQTVLFLDEIHRFNKAQQDALLPAVEEGLLTLIGATTENPAFEINGALLSRLRVYALQALSAEEVGTVLRRAAEGTIPVEEQALDFLAARSEGTRARRSTRSSWRWPPPSSWATSVWAWRASRMRCSGAPCSTTKAATATTTTYPPGSRPLAALTPTPRFTTSR